MEGELTNFSNFPHKQKKMYPAQGEGIPPVKHWHSKLTPCRDVKSESISLGRNFQTKILVRELVQAGEISSCLGLFYKFCFLLLGIKSPQIFLLVENISDFLGKKKS
jgi:hypothetical protein